MKDALPACLVAGIAVIAALAARPASAQVSNLTVERRLHWEGLEFRWGPCRQRCDFIQVIFEADGGRPQQYELPKEQSTYTTSFVPRTALFAIQTCRKARFPDAGGTRCSGWQHLSYPPYQPPRPVAPTGLRALPGGSWQGHEYRATVTLTWQAAQHTPTVVIYAEAGGQSRLISELPVEVTVFDTALPAGELHVFAVCVERNYRCAKTSVQIVPVPKAPGGVSLSHRLPDGIRFAWIGDNVTESFEIQRRELPLAAARLAPEPSGTGFSAAGQRTGTGAARVGAATQARAAATADRIGATAPRPTERAAIPAPPPSQWVVVGRSIGGNRKPNSRYEIGHVTPATSQYRVCAVNKAGRACSEPATVGGSPAQRAPGAFR